MILILVIIIIPLYIHTYLIWMDHILLYSQFIGYGMANGTLFNIHRCIFMEKHVRSLPAANNKQHLHYASSFT